MAKLLTMEKTNPSFNNATELLAEERYDELPELFDIPKAVEKFAEWKHRQSQTERFDTKDEVIHNHVVGRVLDFMKSEGLPYKPLSKVSG